jgi:iron complex transport system ATP-binding protein
MTARIEGTGLSATADGRHVLDGVDVRLHAGEVLGLIGANGAGKTTLLRALLRLSPLSAGRVTLDGRDITGAAPHRVAREVAYLPQDRSVFWPLPVARLVALGRMPHAAPRLFGRDPADTGHPAVERAMRRTDVLHLRDRAADALSGGERARVLLARALAVEAPVLLADEPVAGLDPYHQLAVMEVFRDAAAEGTAVALVVHDLSLAARFCDRLVLMREGTVLGDGTPHAVLDDANLARVYGVRVSRGPDGTLTPVARVGEAP